MRIALIEYYLNYVLFTEYITKYDYDFQGKIDVELKDRVNVHDMRILSNNRVLIHTHKHFKIWDLKTNTVTYIVKIKGIHYFELLSDERIIISYGDGFLRVFNLNDLSIPEYEFFTNNNSSQIIILSDNRVALYMLNNDISIYDLKNRNVILLKGHTNKITCVVPYGHNKLISGSYDTDIKIWNLSDYSCETTLTGHKQPIRSIVTLSDRIVSYDIGQIRIWKDRICRVVIDNKYAISQMIVTYDDRFICICYDIKIYNNRGKCETTLSVNKNNIKLLLLPNNQLVSICPEEFKIWDLCKKLCIKTIFIQGITKMNLLSDGRVITNNHTGLLIWR